MNRGCISDSEAYKCNDIGNRCSLCHESDGCNSQAQYRPSSLTCIKCTGTEECKWGFQASAATLCPSLIGYGLNQSCFTLETPTLVRRGCQVELDTEICSDANCKLCPDEGCNRNNVVVQTCQVCESDVDGEELCSETGVIGFEKSCSSSEDVVEYGNRGCFTKNQGKIYNNYSS